MYRSINIMGYNIFTDELSQITPDPNKKQIINTLNSHSYITAKNDSAFKNALKTSDTLLPDGSGIVLAAQIIENTKIKKIAGSDLHLHLLSVLNQTHGSVFYMGASRHTLDMIHNKIAKEYPNVVVGSYSPSFRAEFSKVTRNK